ncbi:MAG: AAA family ATPase [Acidobacteria bacterium]|nr:AAA family ATPase [Acidobacteriota bacterium]MBU1473921.1 AAA family ATPase [Acidobacteriota bacterium]
MVRSELIKRSPLRILEKAMGGSLGRGRIGVLASRKGVGKTACLVHIATDKLFQNKPVIHVSYSSRVDYIINRYEDIFREIAKKRNLESAVDVHDDIIKNRVIMNFKQDGRQVDQVLNSVRAMTEHGRFPAEVIIVDGFDFVNADFAEFHKFHDFAGQIGAEAWFSASLRGDEPIFDEWGFPEVLKPFDADIDVLITLGYKEDSIRLHLMKNGDKDVPGELSIRFDPKTMLIAE